MKDNAIQQITELLDREIQLKHMPGAIFSLWQDGAEVFSVIRGVADLESQRPLARDSLFRIYSMSKPVTAVAAMMLVDAGKLRLTDRVADYLPEYAHMNRLDDDGVIRPCAQEMTLWHLLSMTSGLTYPGPDAVGTYMQKCFDAFEADNMAGKGPTTHELAKLIAAQPLAFEPGTHWRYGLSADVMGAVIEVVSGMRFSDFLRERIFEPLGMRDTGFYVPPEKVQRFTTLYHMENGGLSVDTGRHLGLTYCLFPPTFESGGAGLITSLEDYARFASMLANRGVYNGTRLLSEASIAQFERGMIGADAYPELLDWQSLHGYRYGCLTRSLCDPSQVGTLGEFGWDGWTGPYVSVDAQYNRFVLLLLQVSGHDDWSLNLRLRDIALS